MNNSPSLVFRRLICVILPRKKPLGGIEGRGRKDLGRKDLGRKKGRKEGPISKFENIPYAYRMCQKKNRDTFCLFPIFYL